MHNQQKHKSNQSTGTIKQTIQINQQAQSTTTSKSINRHNQKINQINQQAQSNTIKKTNQSTGTKPQKRTTNQSTCTMKNKKNIKSINRHRQ